jgi:hypothetical protein
MPNPNHPAKPTQQQRSTTMHSTPITKRSRRRTRLTLAAGLTAALAACALPAAASAATVGIVDDTLSYQGGSERNSLSLREVAGTLIVSDTSGVSNIFTAPPLPPAPCAQVDSRTLRCPLVDRVVARMAGGDDTAGPINTHLPVEIRGDSGNDTYNAGSPSFLTNVTFAGGTGGEDTVSYAGSGGSGAGGVQISNDGRANDGRIGLDTDNVGRDVEVLTGSRFADQIAANGPLDLRVTGVFAFTSVRGGQGDDVLRVGADGNQGVEILNGPVADGADKIIGGPAVSFVDYSERTRAVTGTLNFGGADDGEAGEGDELLGGNEVLLGGQAGDILRAPFGSRARHSIDGNGGGDFIEGADGPDRLVGGPGLRDVIVAAGGDDQLLAKDGERDEVDCGLGTDTFEADSVDDLGSCENGTIGVLRLAPKALRVKAGKPARLALSWRHPRSWRQLRRVELRLYRGKARVGAVAISPRTRRIADRGAVIMLRRSRLVRRGKTVSARLALRLGRSLAGRRLRVEVAAVDVRGARQLEPRAGSIRVSR